jgi:hypothetical protein
VSTPFSSAVQHLDTADTYEEPAGHEQALHTQLEEHVCVPPLEQLCVVPAAQAPPPLHAPHVPVCQLPFEVSHVTVLVCVPKLQLPQAWLSAGLLPLQGVEPPLQALHAPHAPPEQLALQYLVCVPPLPQLWLVGCVCVGE